MICWETYVINDLEGDWCTSSLTRFYFFLATIECKNTEFGCCADGKTISKGYFKEGCKGKRESQCEKHNEYLTVYCKL